MDKFIMFFGLDNTTYVLKTSSISGMQKCKKVGLENSFLCTIAIDTMVGAIPISESEFDRIVSLLT